jgi:hypothetical protein
MAKPEGPVVIHALAKGAPTASDPITRVSLLGHPGSLPWRQDENGLTVTVPLDEIGKYGCALKIE